MDFYLLIRSILQNRRHTRFGTYWCFSRSWATCRCSWIILSNVVTLLVIYKHMTSTISLTSE